MQRKTNTKRMQKKCKTWCETNAKHMQTETKGKQARKLNRPESWYDFGTDCWSHPQRTTWITPNYIWITPESHLNHTKLHLDHTWIKPESHQIKSELHLNHTWIRPESYWITPESHWITPELHLNHSESHLNHTE
jgi:hypothetical protein